MLSLMNYALYEGGDFAEKKNNVLERFLFLQ